MFTNYAQDLPCDPAFNQLPRHEPENIFQNNWSKVPVDHSSSSSCSSTLSLQQMNMVNQLNFLHSKADNSQLSTNNSLNFFTSFDDPMQEEQIQQLLQQRELEVIALEKLLLSHRIKNAIQQEQLNFHLYQASKQKIFHPLQLIPPIKSMETPSSFTTEFMQREELPIERKNLPESNMCRFRQLESPISPHLCHPSVSKLAHFIAYIYTFDKQKLEDGDIINRIFGTNPPSASILTHQKITGEKIEQDQKGSKMNEDNKKITQSRETENLIKTVLNTDPNHIYQIDPNDDDNMQIISCQNQIQTKSCQNQIQTNQNGSKKRRGEEFSSKILSQMEGFLSKNMKLDSYNTEKSGKGIKIIVKPSSEMGLNFNDVSKEIKVEIDGNFEEVKNEVINILYSFKSSHKVYFKQVRSQKEMLKDTKFHNLNKRIMRVLLSILTNPIVLTLKIPLSVFHFFQALSLKMAQSSKKIIQNTTVNDQYSHAHYSVMFLQISLLNYHELQKSQLDVALHKIIYDLDLTIPFHQNYFAVNAANILKKYIYLLLDLTLNLNDSSNDSSLQAVRSLYIERVLCGMEKMDKGKIVHRF